MGLFFVKGTNILQGKIANVAGGSETYGSFREGTGTIHHNNLWTFRINNKPVSFKTKENLSFSDGDNLTAVGGEKNGTLHIICLRNDTTGQTYDPPVKLLKIGGWAIILISIPMIFVLIGIFLIIPGILFVREAGWATKAMNVLRATPPVRTA